MRRFSLASLCLVLSMVQVTLAQAHTAAQTLQNKLENCLHDVSGRVGIAVVCEGRVIASVNDRHRYPLMSVAKLVQGMSVAEMMQTERLPLDTLLTIPRDDLKPNTYSPLRDSLPRGEVRMTVARLLDYSIQLSDNNACDILFRFTGGPAATERYAKRMGYRPMAVRYTEDEMHRDARLWSGNWSRPSVVARLIYDLFNSPRFAGPAYEHVRTALVQCRTGQTRISAGVTQTGAVIAHKTGTGDARDGLQHGINDVAYIKLPGGPHYALAVFIDHTSLTLAEAERLMATLSQCVATWMLHAE